MSVLSALFITDILFETELLFRRHRHEVRHLVFGVHIPTYVDTLKTVRCTHMSAWPFADWSSESHDGRHGYGITCISMFYLTSSTRLLAVSSPLKTIINEFRRNETADRMVPGSIPANSHSRVAWPFWPAHIRGQPVLSPSSRSYYLLGHTAATIAGRNAHNTTQTGEGVSRPAHVQTYIDAFAGGFGLHVSHSLSIAKHMYRVIYHFNERTGCKWPRLLTLSIVSEGTTNNVCCRAITHIDPVYMSRKIRKFRTDKFDTWNKRKFWLMQLM